MKEKTKAKTVLLLMVTNLLVKVFGLLREILIAKYYGTGMYTDAYIIANNIPTVLFAALGMSLATTFIPMYSKIQVKDGKERADLFTIHLIEVILMICLVMSIFGEIFTEKFVFIFASGFQGEALDITTRFVKILFPSIFAMALMNIFGSFLQIHNDFKPIALVPVAGNLTIILSLLVSNYFENVYILVWGTLFGLIAQVLFYLPRILYHIRVPKKRGKLWKDPYLFQLLPLVVPVFLGEAVNDINTIVDRTLVSSLAVGSVAALNYAYKVISLILGVSVVALVTIVYPELSKLSAEKNREMFSNKAEEAILVVFAFVLPIALAVIILRTDIVKLLFERGNFDLESTARTSKALACYAIGLVGMGLREMLVKIFFSTQNTKTPMINGVCCTFVNIGLSICLVKWIGFEGAAIATSIVAIVSCLNLIRLCVKKEIIHIKSIGISFVKTVVASACFTCGLLFCMNVLRDRYEFGLIYVIGCAIVSIICVGLYFVVQLCLKNRVVIDFVKTIRR